MTVELKSEGSQKQQLLRLLDWLKEIGMVSSYQIRKSNDDEIPASLHHSLNLNGNLSQAAKAALEKVEKLKSLEKNWDSYQADPPSAFAISSSQSFIKKADQDGLQTYFVAPGRSGEVLVEFKNGDKAAEVYFEPDGSAEVLMYENEECVLEGNLNENYEKLTTFLNA
ncbi:MAG: hypothetical protein AAB316_04290 [Bacteroidota bacterium]